MGENYYGRRKSGKTRDHETERAGVKRCINKTRDLLAENGLTITQESLPETVESLPETVKEGCLEEFNKEIAGNEELISNIGCLSSSLEVVHTLGYGGKTVPKERVKGIKDAYGNIIQPRQVEQVSCIVGYIIRNIGNTAINYMTEVFRYSETTNKYVGERICQVLEPGGEAQISTLYFNMLLLMPEFNCEVANGKLVCNGYYKPELNDTLDELMTSLGKFYFRFKGNKRVHDQASGIKLPIADPVLDSNNAVKGWCVTPTYIETFGNLNNHKRLTYKIKTKGFDSASDMAKYMRKVSGGVF
mgnify:CR=1 FL=1